MFGLLILTFERVTGVVQIAKTASKAKGKAKGAAKGGLGGLFGGKK